jgi:hypothetical protein
MEDVRTFTGQTVTLSFWAKGTFSTAFTLGNFQYFGSGGSASVNTTIGTFTPTASWTRYTFTFNVPSISGKTIGDATNYSSIYFDNAVTSTGQFDIWGVQLEAGSVATPFTTATGTLQGELAAAQRYYIRQGGDSSYQLFGSGVAFATTSILIDCPLPVTMRATPSLSSDFSTLAVQDGVSVLSVSSIGTNSMGRNHASLSCTVSGATQWRPYILCANNSTSSYIGFSAEL